jgi:biopolymer transport protein ExbD
MDLIPKDKQSIQFNFAPMIDFLFIMLALFATLAISRSTLYDMNMDLVKKKRSTETQSIDKKDFHYINISISPSGEYKWITEVSSHLIENQEKIEEEIYRQYAMGLLPKNKSQTKILLHIDKQAPWEKIAELLFTVRKIGFEVCPVYEKQ